MDFTKKIKRFKLLIPTHGFADWIAQSGSESAPLLHARLVYSWLAFRSRNGAGASNRAVSRELGLHPATVAKAVDSLTGLIRRHDGEWGALEPPQGLFITRTTVEPCKHWSDGLAYLTLLLPRRGAVIKYPATTRKFGLNHALVYSHLLGKAKKDADGVVRGFTMAGAAKLFDLDPKTVSSIVNDLLWLGLAQQVDLGRRSDITVAGSLTGEQLALFEPKAEPVRKVVEAKEKLPRSATAPYQYRGDTWDDCRRLCHGLMSQNRAEEAIAKAQRLRWTPEDFEAEFHRLKNLHDQNVLEGKVGKGNFGKYVNACYDNKVAILNEQERKEREAQRLQELFDSPEFKQRLAEERKAAQADPLSRGFVLDNDAIHDRVLLGDGLVTPYRALDRISSRLYEHIRAFVAAKRLTTQQEIDETASLKNKILRHALATLNGHYKQPVLATQEQFERTIDDAITKVEPTLTPLFHQPSQEAVQHAR